MKHLFYAASWASMLTPLPAMAQEASAPQTTTSETVTIDPAKPFAQYLRIKGYPEIPDAETSFSVPPAPRQTMIDYVKPPVLDYTIPGAWQGMNIACGETSRSFLKEAAATCAPVLELLKLNTRMEFAIEDARRHLTEDPEFAQSRHDEAMRIADAIFARPRDEAWPLEIKLLSDSYRAISGLHEMWSEGAEAIAMQDARIALLSDGEKYPNAAGLFSSKADFTSSTDLAQAYMQKGELLLAKGDRDAAIANYEEAFAKAEAKDFYVIFAPIRDHTKAMVKDAIFARDYQRALGWIERYFIVFRDNAETYGAAADLTGEIAQRDLLAFRIYILAALGRRDQVVDALGEYEKTRTTRGFDTCSTRELFPQVIAPFHKDPAIRARLVALGCSDAVLAELDNVPEKGVILPPHKEPALPPHGN